MSKTREVIMCYIIITKKRKEEDNTRQNKSILKKF